MHPCAKGFVSLLVLAAAGCGSATLPLPALPEQLEPDGEAVETPSALPRKLAIYYGQPSEVNGSGGDVARAIDTFKVYDVLVLGAGLDAASHPDHAKTQNIIAGVADTTQVYGYVDLCVRAAGVLPCTNLPLEEIAAKTSRWKAMGVAGIFLDQAGYDFAVSRERLNQAVKGVHAQGLSAFVNARSPDDVFSDSVNPQFNPGGVATVLGPKDYVLDESFGVELSNFTDPASVIAKAEKELQYRKRFGTRIATTNTVAMSNPPFEQAKLDYVWWLSLLFGFDAMAWGETWSYSANNNALPFHSRPDPGPPGDAITPLTVTHQGTLHTRATRGRTIEVDSATHGGRLQGGTVFSQPATQSANLLSADARLGATQLTIIFQSNGALIGSYRVFIDSDNQRDTGFLHAQNNTIGADLMVENGLLYRFGGASQVAFEWMSVGPAEVMGAGSARIQVGVSPPLGAEVAILIESVNPADFTTVDMLPRTTAVWRVKP